ncbi:hypothetical protein [Streptomyces sp. NPDC005989]
MTAKESEKHEMHGASGPGITIYIHKRGCSLPAVSTPTPYPKERRY